MAALSARLSRQGHAPGPARGECRHPAPARRRSDRPGCRPTARVSGGRPGDQHADARERQIVVGDGIRVAALAHAARPPRRSPRRARDTAGSGTRRFRTIVLWLDRNRWMRPAACCRRASLSARYVSRRRPPARSRSAPPRAATPVTRAADACRAAGCRRRTRPPAARGPRSSRSSVSVRSAVDRSGRAPAAGDIGAGDAMVPAAVEPNAEAVAPDRAAQHGHAVHVPARHARRRRTARAPSRRSRGDAGQVDPGARGRGDQHAALAPGRRSGSGRGRSRTSPCTWVPGAGEPDARRARPAAGGGGQEQAAQQRAVTRGAHGRTG